MTTTADEISNQMKAMQDDLTSALEAERVARVALEEASLEFASQKKDMWDATGHYIRAQKRKLALSVALRERETKTKELAERTGEVLKENGDLQRELELLVSHDERNAKTFVRHLLDLRRVVQGYQQEFDDTLQHSSQAEAEAATSRETLELASSRLAAALLESKKILGFLERVRAETERIDLKASALGKGIAAATTRRKAAQDKVSEASSRLSELQCKLDCGED